MAAAAAKLLDQLAEPEATFCGGRRTFHYRGIEAPRHASRLIEFRIGKLFLVSSNHIRMKAMP